MYMFTIGDSQWEGGVSVVGTGGREEGSGLMGGAIGRGGVGKRGGRMKGRGW